MGSVVVDFSGVQFASKFRGLGLGSITPGKQPQLCHHTKDDPLSTSSALFPNHVASREAQFRPHALSAVGKVMAVSRETFQCRRLAQPASHPRPNHPIKPA